MVRKKKETTTEEVKQDVAVAEEPKVEDLQESAEQEEEKPKKKREIKKLSETELKRVMTDTKETLVPITEYIAHSIHLGTKVITPDMRKFVYKRRADGLAVLNTNLIDDKLREAAKFLNQFAPEDVFIACKREAGWPAVEKFSEVTGIRSFCKKYPAGIITNIKLDNFFEAKLVMVCDPWVDKNALNDALKLQLPVIGICDTNNYAPGIKQIIPANNKSRKSLGIVLYILAREYLKAQGKTDEAKALKMEDFAGKVEVMEPMNNSGVEAEKVTEGV
jgi:small subunit ribosomal protein S2